MTIQSLVTHGGSALVRYDAAQVRIAAALDLGAEILGVSADGDRALAVCDDRLIGVDLG